MSTVIEFQDVSKHFMIQRDRRNTLHERLTGLFRRRLDGDEFWALRDVSFAVQRGETVGLIGHNGSGKSTTLKLVTRILEPTSGRVLVNGRISALLELGSGFHPDLSGRENIYLNGSILGYSRAEMRRKMDEIIDFAEMEEFIDMPVKHYSSGMYMRLGFSVAVAVDPDILITDEVLSVGDEHFQRKCLDRIYDLREKGRTILFVSHALGQVQALCDRVLWFDHGKLMGDGEPVEMIDGYLQTVNLAERERIERKHEEAEEAEPAAAEEVEDPRRWGSREVEITRVEVLSGNGKRRSIFRTGDSMVLRIHYLAHKRIEEPVFGLAIFHRNGAHINGPNTRFSGYDIAALEGEGYLDYRVESLPLLEGEYQVTVGVFDRGMIHPFDYHDRKYSFNVQATSTSERYGLVHIPARWQSETLELSTSQSKPRDRSLEVHP